MNRNTEYPDGFETTALPTDWRGYCIAERRSIFDEATARMLPCPEEYADKDVLARWENMERRDIIGEMEGELLDLINYAAAQVIKLRVMRDYLHK